MTRGLYALGRWCALRGRVVVLLWLSVLGLLGGAHLLLPPPALDPFVLAGTESATAQVLLIRAFPGAAAEAAPLVVHDDADLRAGPGKAIVTAVAAAARGSDGVSKVSSPAEDRTLMAADGHTAIVRVTMAERAAGSADAGQLLLDNATAAARTHSATAVVALGGYLGEQTSGLDTGFVEVIGVAIALLVLLSVFRRLWPVAIPLLTAGVAVGVGLSITKLLGRMVYIPNEAPTLGLMLGLGVGIDYALFLITRHRILLRRGFPVVDAIGRTAGTAGAGLVFAGATLFTAVSGLALTGISFLAWLGYSAAVMVAVALSTALTLVPGLLGLLGPRVLSVREEAHYRAGGFGQQDDFPAETEPHPTETPSQTPPTSPSPAQLPWHSDHHLDASGWARIADAVTSHAWPWTIAASTLLLALATPMLGMRFQQTDATALPADATAHIATVLIADAFGPGYTAPLAVVGQLYRPATAPADTANTGDPRAEDARLRHVTAALTGTAGVHDVADPVVSTDGGVVLWRITPSTGPSDPRTERLVGELRREVLPAAVSGREMSAYVGGVTAARTDLTERVAERLLPFIIGVASLSFLLLLLAYRSLIIPAKAALMNIISISAAYGVVVMVFQWGWGARLIGLDGPVPIESYVPMMMFAVLFGLSMDYEVFLLTAFTEHYQRTGDIVTAIRRALADTGQVITSAALIMVAVFASFVLTGASIIKMFGVGLATAVFVDATVVRCVLVPALMVLAARWTWWLPSWLERALPRLHVEGDPARLESIHEGRASLPGDQAAGAPAWAAMLGVSVGWLLGTGAAAPVPGVEFAVVIAATAGSLLACLPRATRWAGQMFASRALGYLLGVLLAAATYLAVGALQPAASRNTAFATGAAVLLPLALIATSRLRRIGLPVAAGALAMAAAANAASPTPSSLGPTLPPVTVPFLVALVLTWLLGAAGRRQAAAHPQPLVPGSDEDQPQQVDAVPAEVDA